MNRHSLPVIVAPRSVAASLIDMLADWSTSDVVDRVLVIDQDSIRRDDFRVPTHEVYAGSSRATSLQDYLADSSGIEHISVVAVGTLRDKAIVPELELVAKVGQAIEVSVPHARVTKIQAIGVTLQGAKLPSELAWFGWHNVIVAPEDSFAPGAGTTRLASDGNQGTLDAHLLTAVCTLAGAWAHAEGSPMDDEQVLHGAQVILFRSYSRLLSAESVDSELLTKVASVDDGYPLPTVGGERAWAVEDESLAVMTMADQLLDKHRYVLPADRPIPPKTSPKKMGIMESLKMFFSFLGASIRNAPRAWADSLVRGVSSRAAGAVNRQIFGKDSEFEVVVNGIKSDGTPASWSDIDDVAGQMISKIGPVVNAQAGSQDLSGFWKDFVGGALTLLDGESRTQEMPAVAIGAHKGVVINGDVVVPRADDIFEPSGSVAANIRGWRVEPADLVRTKMLERELNRVADESSMLRSAALEDRDRLQAWGESRRRTYSGRVGFRIGEGVDRTRAEIASLLKKLEAANRAMELPDEIEATQKRLARKLVLFLGGLLIGFVGVGVLLWIGAIGKYLALAMGIGLLIAWLIGSVISFVKGQGELFSLLHSKREMAGHKEILEQHLGGAITDLRRLIRAYRQYLDWARVLGAFIAAPNGRVESTTREAIPLGVGLPRSIAFGEVQPQSHIVDEVAARLRQDIYRVGWLSGSWDAFFNDVPAEIGTRSFEVTEQPDLIWADHGRSDQSLLTAWSSAVAARGRVLVH